MADTILQRGPLLPALEHELAKRYHVIRYDADANPATVNAGHARVLVTSNKHGADAPTMGAFPDLGAIVGFGVGYESFDLSAARAHGIAVSNTPDVLTSCVADLAMGAVIAVARSLCAADRFVRADAWLRHDFPLSTRVHGKRLGILGLGRIGHAVARRAEAFDLAIRYHNRRSVPGCPYRYHESVTALAADSDFLVVCAAGGPQTNAMVNTEVLAELGPEGFLVNIARGSVVDEPALVLALEGGTIAGAALDVHANEPQVAPGLLDRDNVVLLPHIASATVETRWAMAELVLANTEQFLTTGALVTPVLDN